MVEKVLISKMQFSNGLPDEFTLTLGDTLGYAGAAAMESIIIQLSNASQPKTMDGDHFRFWVNQDTAEASLSLKISDIAASTIFPSKP